MSYPLSTDIQGLLYIVASVLFILGLKLLSKPGTARKGNAVSAVGMLLAVLTALASEQILQWQWILLGLAVGAVVGALAARLVAMTAMPEMVALFNGFGGIASLLVGWAEFHRLYSAGELAGKGWGGVLIIALTVLIGGVTFTGSLVAWAKLAGVIPTKPLVYPGQQLVNGLLVVGIVAAAVALGLSPEAYGVLLVLVAAALILGILSVIPIGGGDMPVVISLLNSYSGMAACAAGFVVGNNVLIVAGALVGSSGIILTNIMCKAMNRSLVNVLFSGFGSGNASSSKAASSVGEVKPISADDAYLLLEAAGNVVIVPGYGMAVAQAQHAVQELGALLEDNGTEVNYAIHPVAGRMPGHMNVLLAEANVPYEQLREMDDINPQMGSVDVAVVIGANDVVNPAAKEEPGSPIYGMPVIEVGAARTVIVLKRSMHTGFAGIENPLFYKDNTRMLFGDAKATVQALVAKFKEG